jgi:hypothetical protein
MTASSGGEIPQKRTPGPRGCLMGAGLFGVMGFGCILVSWMLFDRTNAGVMHGAVELADILSLASRAPGAAEVLALGCETAGVLEPEDLKLLAERLEAEEATAKKRPPRPVTIGAEEPVVYCAHPAAGEPSCARVAEVYRARTQPSTPFVVTVRTGFRETCSERFDAAGTSKGAAPSPNLPLLVTPR